MHHEQRNEHTAGKSHCQTSDVDKRMRFVPSHAPQSDLDVVAQHGKTPVNRIVDEAGQRPENLRP